MRLWILSFAFLMFILPVSAQDLSYDIEADNALIHMAAVAGPAVRLDFAKIGKSGGSTFEFNMTEWEQFKTLFNRAAVEVPDDGSDMSMAHRSMEPIGQIAGLHLWHLADNSVGDSVVFTKDNRTLAELDPKKTLEFIKRMTELSNAIKKQQQP